MKKNSVDPPETLEQLKQCAQQHWDEITPYTLRHLYNQMRHRIHLLQRMCNYPTKSLMSYEWIEIYNPINDLFFFVW